MACLHARVLENHALATLRAIGDAWQLAAYRKAQRAQPVVDTLIKFQSGGVHVLCEFPSIATVKFQAIETPEDANTHRKQQDVAHIHKLQLQYLRSVTSQLKNQHINPPLTNPWHHPAYWFPKSALGPGATRGFFVPHSAPAALLGWAMHTARPHCQNSFNFVG
jgi:hypothetical protein